MIARRFPSLPHFLAWSVCFIGMALLSGCETAPHERLVPQATRRGTGDLGIISAVYGSGTNFVDVTYRLKSLFDRQPMFFARPEWLDPGAPADGANTLIIVYTLRGQRRIFSTDEGGKVSYEILASRGRVS